LIDRHCGEITRFEDITELRNDLKVRKKFEELWKIYTSPDK